MKKTAKRARSVICSAVSFLMSLTFTLTVLCIALSLTVLNPKFAVKTAVPAILTRLFLTASLRM